MDAQFKQALDNERSRLLREKSYDIASFNKIEGLNPRTAKLKFWTTDGGWVEILYRWRNNNLIHGQHLRKGGVDRR